MLSHAVRGALTARGVSPSARSLLSTSRVQSFAKDSKPRYTPRKAAPSKTAASPPPPASPLKKVTGTVNGGGQTSVAKSSDGPSPSRASPSRSRQNADTSSVQDALRASAGSRAKTASTTASSSTADGAPGSGSKGPLPDLTKGIPSTLDAELAHAASAAPADGSKRTLNLTEDPARSGGGRNDGGGDLPKTAYISSLDRRRNRLANFMYAGFVLFAVTGTVYLGRNWENAEDERQHPETPSGWAMALFFGRARARVTDMLAYYNEPAFRKLLPDPDPMFERPFTLVLSLEDLLIHSEWTREHGWRMAKRPGVDYFLRYLQQYYELVIFTSVPSHIAEPVIMKLDPFRIVTWPLFREATKYKNGQHIKDLSFLNRDLSKVIIIDTDPTHTQMQPENAIILPKWKGDPQDKELVSLIPFLEYVATMGLNDTRSVLKSFDGTDIPTEFAAREAVARRKFDEQLAEERGSRPKRVGRGVMNSLLGIRSVTVEGYDQTPAEGFEQGKMLQDQIRERGQKQYEALEKEIRENGDKWLKEMAAETKKMTDEQMKGMKNSLTSMFVVGGGGGGGGGAPEPTK
ncbi:MAG: mitochondrial inner membrane protein required for protein import [Thelocarpon superellum]|nr:MAG: mitochondrial inner membrane protein required for protein import [Thelocarpon superellum]